VSGSYTSGNAKSAIGTGTGTLIAEVYSDTSCSSSALSQIQIVALNTCQTTQYSSSVKFTVTGNTVSGQYFTDTNCNNLYPSVTASGTADGNCGQFTLNGVKVNGKLFTAASLNSITAECMVNTSFKACASSPAMSLFDRNGHDGDNGSNGNNGGVVWIHLARSGAVALTLYFYIM
jgi:hypothetical protein